MLKNKSLEFENLMLKEELDIVKTENVLLAEADNALVPAGDVKDNSKDDKGFKEKAKEFFGKVIKFLTDLLNAVKDFVVKAYKNITDRKNQVLEYITATKDEDIKSKPEAITVSVAKEAGSDVNALLGLVGEEGFESKASEVSEKLGQKEEVKIDSLSKAKSAVGVADQQARHVKAYSTAINAASKKGITEAKTALQEAGRGDKDAVAKKKTTTNQYKRTAALGRKAASGSIKSANAVLGSAYKYVKAARKDSKEDKQEA